MRLIVCDRCRQEIRGVSKTGYINLDKRDIGTGVLEGNREFDEWDLCDDCLMQIRDFVHMAPRTQNVLPNRIRGRQKNRSRSMWTRATGWRQNQRGQKLELIPKQS